jgi:sugar phosphate isomerase/epimerase
MMGQDERGTVSITRRAFLTQTTAALAGTALLPQLQGAQAAATAAKIRIGACVVGLEQAREAGLEGVEVGVGAAAERLAIADAEVRARYKEQMQQTGLPICSLMMGLFNSHPLASDPRAPAWIEQSIDAAQDLGARVILLAFFGNGDLLDANEQVRESAVDVAVERIGAAAPRAKDAGVTLAIENYLNGEQNARILDRIGHEAVQLYFDVYNTGTTTGHDVPADIRRLQGRIAQYHFKNGDRYLDADKATFEPIAAAIRESEYRGWIVLETSSPSRNAVADVKRNGDYARSLFA